MSRGFRRAQAERHSPVLFQSFSMREIDSTWYLGGFPDLRGAQSINSQH